MHVDFFSHEHSIETPGIVNFINQFGQLWTGTLSKQHFINKFNQQYQNFLYDLKYLDDLEFEKYDSVKFQYNLVRESLKQPWWSPVFLNSLDHWPVGNSRLLATGITKHNPWQHLKILFLSSDLKVPPLDSLLKIDTDQELKQQFINPTGYQTLLGFSETVQKELQVAIFRKDLYEKNKTVKKQNFLDDYIRWKKIYKKPTLKVYTNWPDLIKDSQGIWNIEYIGFSPRKSYLNAPHVESVVKEFYENKITEHCLLVNDPVRLDISSFMCFADLTHTNYIDNDWKFLFFRPGSQKYSNTFISINEYY